jgi:hypothetical protein
MKKLCFLLLFPAVIPNLAPVVFKKRKKPKVYVEFQTDE